MASNFAATVGAWAHDVDMAVEAIFKESAQELASESDQLLVDLIYSRPPSSNYRRTSFLRASFLASTSQMPEINPAARPAESGSYQFDGAEIAAVIAGTELGQPLFMGYTAAYALRVHYGFVGTDSLGRAYDQPGRPWVLMAAQRWPAIVAAKEAELKSRLGLD